MGTQTAAPDPLVARYLAHVQFEKRLAERTLALYTLDLEKLAQNARQGGLDLLQVLSLIHI